MAGPVGTFQGGAGSALSHVPVIQDLLSGRHCASTGDTTVSKADRLPVLVTGGGGDVSQVRHSLQTQPRYLQLARFSPTSLSVPSHSFVASSSCPQPSEKSPQNSLISPLFSFCSLCSSHTDFVTCFLLLSLYIAVPSARNAFPSGYLHGWCPCPLQVFPPRLPSLGPS